MKQNITNYWQLFIYTLTHRRGFIPLLSLYFLTFPDTNVQMIGIYTAIGSIVGFFMETPSGYISDRIGHKKALIIAKVSMLLSTTCFLFFHDFVGFSLGAIFLSIGFSFSSGTDSAFFHNTLESIGREKEFSKIFGDLQGKVSLLSMCIIIGLPFFTSISFDFPFILSLILDLIGLAVAFLLVEPENTHIHKGKKHKPLGEIFRESQQLNFLPFAIFIGSISGFLVGINPYNPIHLTELGYPVILIGIIMGLSRGVWFVVSRYAYLIEKHLSPKQWLQMELLIYVSAFFLFSILTNPYIFAIILMFVSGYQHGRIQVVDSYTFKTYLTDPRYKATILSISRQLSLFVSTALTFLLSFVVVYSYQLGYFVASVLLLITLGVCYYLIFKKQSGDKKY